MNKHYDMSGFNLQLFAAEEDVITSEQMAKAREVDFVQRFTGESLVKLMEMLGVTRRIPMMEGTTLYMYKTTGELNEAQVAEGDIIPLSRYQREKVPMGEISLKKLRKAVTAEAIKKSGLLEALQATDQKMIQDVQSVIRRAFFEYMLAFAHPSYVIGGQPVAKEGVVLEAQTLQEALAKSWGALQILFENDSTEAVHFINPMTIADYLATATVTTQTAFGMRYIEDFLGMGTVIMNSMVPLNAVYSTAKENLILYYLTMDGDVAHAFNLTTDETGFIGIHTSQTDNRAQIETLVLFGIDILLEVSNGLVLATLPGYRMELGSAADILSGDEDDIPELPIGGDSGSGGGSGSSSGSGGDSGSGSGGDSGSGGGK